MAEPDEIEDDLFADLYDGDDNDTKAATEAPAPAVAASTTDNSSKPSNGTDPVARSIENPGNYQQHDEDNEPAVYGEDIYDNGGMTNLQADDSGPVVNDHGFSGTVGIKEDG